MPLKIIKTEDGSQSLYNEELNETYHSTKGAQSESEYVFIDKALNHWIESNPTTSYQYPISILEVGFGTGLNAWLTLKWAQEKKRSVHFYSLEPFPIPEEVWSKMDLISDEQFGDLHRAAWNEEERFGDFFILEKRIIGLEQLDKQEVFDVIYFDAFAPSKQPEVWAIENLKRCFDSLRSGGILTTYCAQGQFKRNLVEVGFEVEVLPGALGKKEMVRASKP